MSTTDVKAVSIESTSTGTENLKLEAIVIPVADVDRSKAFYSGLSWRLDADFAFDNGFRVVQFNPPGSPASVQFGSKITTAAPGSAQGLYLVVSDIDAARAELARHGAQVSNVFHPSAPGGQFKPAAAGARADGRADGDGSYGSFATFEDPDGNTWLLQEVTTRLPGRVEETATAYATVHDLEVAMTRASLAHGEHEARNGGERDEQWPAWYAAYMVAEQHGAELPR